MSTSGTTGQVLGASTAVAGGIAALPKTSGSFFLSGIALIAIVSGAAVILNLIVTKIYRKLAK